MRRRKIRNIAAMELKCVREIAAMAEETRSGGAKVTLKKITLNNVAKFQ